MESLAYGGLSNMYAVVAHKDRHLLEGREASVLPGCNYFWMWIACEGFLSRALLRTACFFLMPWGRFPTDDQLRHLINEPRILGLEPLILEVAADYSARCICSDARPNLSFIWWDVKSILEHIIANIKRSSLCWNTRLYGAFSVWGWSWIGVYLGASR